MRRQPHRRKWPSLEEMTESCPTRSPADFFIHDIHPIAGEMYRPTAHKLIPPEGCWIGITRQLPPISGGGDLTVLPGRAFWCERAPGSDAGGRGADGTYKGRIVGLPCGDVYVYPHEYVVLEIADLLDGWMAGKLRFEPTRVELARAHDVTFYARSRGVPLVDAAAMALGSLVASIGFFEKTEAMS